MTLRRKIFLSFNLWMPLKVKSFHTTSLVPANCLTAYFKKDTPCLRFAQLQNAFTMIYHSSKHQLENVVLCCKWSCVLCFCSFAERQSLLAQGSYLNMPRLSMALTRLLSFLAPRIPERFDGEAVNLVQKVFEMPEKQLLQTMLRFIVYLSSNNMLSSYELKPIIGLITRQVPKSVLRAFFF